MEKLIDGIYFFANLMSSQYLIEDGEGLTLIDTGILGNDRVILNGISSLGYSISALKRILITHADGDHYGALHRLQAQTSAQTWTSAPEADAIRNGKVSRELMPDTLLKKVAVYALSPAMRSSPAVVDRILAPGEQLPVLDGMIVINSSGHTPGHLSFYLSEKRILFSGDSIFRKNGKFIPSYGINCWDEALAIKSMETQLMLGPQIICGGHNIFRLES